MLGNNVLRDYINELLYFYTYIIYIQYKHSLLAIYFSLNKLDIFGKVAKLQGCMHLRLKIRIKTIEKSSCRLIHDQYLTNNFILKF